MPLEAALGKQVKLQALPQTSNPLILGQLMKMYCPALVGTFWNCISITGTASLCLMT